MAQLKAMEAKDDPASLRQWKFSIIRMLYDKGHDREYVLNLFRFIDWVMRLPEDIERAFLADLYQLEEERAMPYVTSAERFGFRRAHSPLPSRPAGGIYSVHTLNVIP